MTDRQEQILIKLIKEYINTAEPVASGHLANFFGLSSATLRNELSVLEQAGYIYQPHVSAGRIPTENGYKYYVEKIFANDSTEISKSHKIAIDEQLQLELVDYHIALKEIAKVVADISQQTVIIAFSYNNIFYTGVSNLFNQPEFLNLECIISLSQLIDKMDESILGIYDDINDDIKVLIGQDNPFDNQCSSLLTRYEFRSSKEDGEGILGLLGPMRMPYGLNKSLLEYLKEKIYNI